MTLITFSLASLIGIPTFRKKILEIVGVKIFQSMQIPYAMTVP